MSMIGKILLYNLSLVPLYFLFIIKKLDVSGLEYIFEEITNLEYYKSLFLNNIICFVLFILILISWISFKKFVDESNIGEDLPQKFENIKNIDFNHLTFIATYILPLLAFTLDSTRDAIFIIFLLIFIGVIYIKTNLYYLNPVFILFGIRVYSAKNSFNKEIILIAKKERMNFVEELRYKKIGEIYFIKGN